MTSTPQTPDTLEPQAATDSTEAQAAGSIPAFRFPFSPDTYAPKDNAPNYPRNHNCDHTQRPGRPPRGTRRSMGKR